MLAQSQALSGFQRPRVQPRTPSTCIAQRPLRCIASAAPREPESTSTVVQQPETTVGPSSTADVDLSKELNKFTRTTAATFAPRSSTAKGKNPAVKGTALYNVFEAQAWISLVIGGLLSYNVLFPSDQPDIARLMGMWSIWMFTIPSLRAKDCTPREKDALNILFVAMPLMNIILPLVWKSFPFIFMADTVMVVAVYYWKGIWQEVYNIPFMAPGALDTPLPGTAAAGANGDSSQDTQQ